MKSEILLEIVKYLIKEGNYELKIPSSYKELKKLYKMLVNLRPPIFIY